MNNNSFIKDGLIMLIQYVENRTKKIDSSINELEKINLDGTFDNSIKLDKGICRGYRRICLYLNVVLKELTSSDLDMTNDEQIDKLVYIIDELSKVKEAYLEEDHYIELGVDEAISSTKDKAYMILGMLYYAHRSTELKYNKEEN